MLLTANTARSVLGVLAPAACGLELKKVRVGLYGVNASGVPGDVELCNATFASNAPGGVTSTAVTPQQLYGRVIAPGFLAGSAWTAGNEPTVLAPIDSYPLTPNGGLVIYDLPLGDSPDCGPGTGFVLRARYPAGISISATFWVERA
ncbi:hypothetical protein [Nonomuraea basaltis]|uniref:hypothetical protein n=1 Tax=Nonomuraea basaltis TaxID=2495887 RepID=UPI00110C4DF1|nr:hypothetical protein [Nonomuraea basaltis]TMR97550.1 hypothetical protein EJK15_17675 [Nonomuraea basaltis]